MDFVPIVCYINNFSLVPQLEIHIFTKKICGLSLQGMDFRKSRCYNFPAKAVQAEQPPGKSALDKEKGHLLQNKKHSFYA